MNSSSMEALIVALLGFFFIGAAIYLIFVILDIIGRWKMHTKAGKAGWHSLIPGLRDYTLFDISTGMGWLGIVYFILNAASGVSSATVFSELQRGNMDAGGGGFLSSLTSLVILGLNIYLAIMTGRAFGRGTAFKVCLFLFPHITRFILGIGESRYLGVYGGDPDGYSQSGYDGYAQTPPPPPVDEYGHTASPSMQPEPPQQEPASPFAQPEPPHTDPGPEMPSMQPDPVQPAEQYFTEEPPHAPEPPHMEPGVCAHCGAPIAPGTRFCGNCGQSV